MPRTKLPELTKEEVYRIRELWDQGEITAGELGRFYKRNAETIRRIGRRDTHTSLPERGEALQRAEQLKKEAAESEARVMALIAGEDPMKDLNEETAK